MTNTRNLLLCFLLCALSSVLIAQDQNPSKVLFVGNSYTYFWNLPQTVAGMAHAQEIQLSTAQSTSGGTNLGQHFRGERELQSVSLIESGQFDAVVLQDHSRRSIDAPDSLLYFGTRLAEKIKASGAQVYLYLTWAREWDPYMQDPIVREYTRLAEASGARIVPVGLAWQRARQLRPGFPLYDDDGSHPSPLGTYLSACVFYGAFTGQSPIGLPHRIITTDKDGEKLYLNIQSEENALFCQKVADEILQSFSR